MPVYVHIFPDGADPGMIETLCLRSIRDNTAYECIEAFIACAASKGMPIPDGFKRDKHLAQVYLAMQKEVQISPGKASHTGAWPFDHDAFRSLRDFLQAI